MSGAAQSRRPVEVTSTMRAFDPQVFDAVWQSVEALIPAHIDRHPLGCHRQRVSDKECFRVMLVRLVTAARGKTQSSSAPRWSRTRRSGRAVTSGSVLASSTPSPMRPSRVMTASSGSTSRTGPGSLPPTARSVVPAPRCPDEDLPPPAVRGSSVTTARRSPSRPARRRGGSRPGPPLNASSQHRGANDEFGAQHEQSSIAPTARGSAHPGRAR